jgi:hypothetical protein
MALPFSVFVGPAAMPLPCAGATITDGGNLELSDVDGSQVVDLSDAVYLLLYLFRAEPAPVLGTQCMPIEGCPTVCQP